MLHMGLERDGGTAAIVVMADLAQRNPLYFNALNPFNYPQAAAFLDAQARIHAPFWNAPSLAVGGSFGPETEIGRNAERFYSILATFAHSDNWAMYAREPRGAAIPRRFHDAQRMEKAWLALLELITACPLTIVHGDEHLGNMFVDSDGTPGFLDWFCRPERWVMSFTIFLIATLDSLDRRSWERALLTHYLSRLSAYGVAAPSFDEAWLAYRCATIYPLFGWFNNSSKWQPEAVNTACAARSAMAVMDHDPFTLLGV
jgi:hypothetical protein